MAETDPSVENTQLLEVSLKVGDGVFKQILFESIAAATYSQVVKTWTKFRPIEEVRTFVWARVESGVQRRYLIQDDADLRAALRTENRITIGAQGHSTYNRNFAIGVAMYLLLHFYLNLSLIWPLCRGDIWSMCIFGNSDPSKQEL